MPTCPRWRPWTSAIPSAASVRSVRTRRAEGRTFTRRRSTSQGQIPCGRRCSKGPFESADLSADRRLGDVRGVSAAGGLTLLGYRHEVLELVDRRLHRTILVEAATMLDSLIPVFVLSDDGDPSGNRTARCRRVPVSVDPRNTTKGPRSIGTLQTMRLDRWSLKPLGTGLFLGSLHRLHDMGRISNKGLCGGQLRLFAVVLAVCGRAAEVMRPSRSWGVGGTGHQHCWS